MLIPRSGQDFLDRTLHVLLVDSALLTVAHRLWMACLTGPLQSGNDSLLLLLPIARVLLLPSLILESYLLGEWFRVT